MISEKILEFAKKGRARVAIGLVKTNPEIIASLHRAKEFADIVVVGEQVGGLSNVTISNNSCRESLVAEKLIDMLANNEVDALVRGNIDAVDSDILHMLARKFGHKLVLRSAILKSCNGKEFLLTPAAISEGNSMQQRLWMAIETAKFAEQMKVIPQIGVLQTGDTRGNSEYVDQSVDEAEYIARACLQNH